MDYRKFLGQSSTQVLPYFGGFSVDARDRRLRVTEKVNPGWWEFSIEGRKASPKSTTEYADLESLPKVRGHFVHHWLFISGNQIDRVHFLPDEEPLPLMPCVTRRWHHGELIFGNFDFEDDAEINAREALEQRSAIASLKGISPSLRIAFGFALLHDVAVEMDVPVSPREVLGRLVSIAEQGSAAATQLLREIQQRRRLAEVQAQASNGQPVQRVRAPQVRNNRLSLQENVALTLDNVSADLVRVRELGGAQMEVTFNFLGERFICVADTNTYQIYDAGICIEGHDRELTLDSLPGVIREAYDSYELNITRR